MTFATVGRRVGAGAAGVGVGGGRGRFGPRWGGVAIGLRYVGEQGALLRGSNCGTLVGVGACRKTGVRRYLPPKKLISIS
jgi:hypothetical protein